MFLCIWQLVDLSDVGLVFVGARVSYSRRLESWLQQLWEVDFFSFRSVCDVFRGVWKSSLPMGNVMWGAVLESWLYYTRTAFALVFSVLSEILVSIWVHFHQLLVTFYFTIYNTGNIPYHSSLIGFSRPVEIWNMISKIRSVMQVPCDTIILPRAHWSQSSQGDEG